MRFHIVAQSVDCSSIDCPALAEPRKGGGECQGEIHKYLSIFKIVTQEVIAVAVGKRGWLGGRVCECAVSLSTVAIACAKRKNRQRSAEGVEAF
jgi:hypothetical protein